MLFIVIVAAILAAFALKAMLTSQAFWVLVFVVFLAALGLHDDKRAERGAALPHETSLTHVDQPEGKSK
jgi:hypothetical protein